MLDNLNSKQKKIIAIIGVIILLVVLYFIYNKNQTIEQYDENILVKTENTVEENSSEEEKIIIVHITGAVKTPGIVKLKEGSRIEDAINMAGGLTEDADISNVNLAYVLDDGVKIKIPSNLDIDITEDSITTENGENIIEEETISKNKEESSLNINKATKEELQNLPGIGQELASRIVDYREQNGKFSNIEDIKNVSGIGESKFEKIKDLITIK